MGGRDISGYSSTWMNIVNEAYSMISKGFDFFKFLRFKLGNGETARFWDERWMEDDILKLRFPRLYALDTCKDGTVATKLAYASLDCSFRRCPRGGAEQMQFEELLADIQKVRLTPMVDRWSWTLTSSGEYSVESVRKEIDEKLVLEGAHKTRWCKFVPIKINAFAWKVMTDSLPSRFNVSRRGITIDSIACGICDLGAETSKHLFFSCSVARQMFRMISRWWDLSYADVESYEDWVGWLASTRIPSNNKLMLEGVFYVLWWSLWVFRNKKIFDATSPRQETLFDELVSKSYYWCRSRCKTKFSLNDWLKNPSLLSL
nr:RNA-directed DNA polymerase, eukaryota [Tanacetum cinerariifolium]